MTKWKISHQSSRKVSQMAQIFYLGNISSNFLNTEQNYNLFGIFQTDS